MNIQGCFKGNIWEPSSRGSRSGISTNDTNNGPDDENHEVGNDKNVSINDKPSLNQNINEAITIKRSNLHVIRKSNNLVQALQLPVCANINPRSLYNCSEEFKTYVQEENIDVVFLSETWERENKPLTDNINIPSHTIISQSSEKRCWGQNSSCN